MWKRDLIQFQDDRNTVKKAHYIAGFSCNLQSLLSPYLCFLVSLNPLFHDIKEGRLNDEKYSKMSKDAKQYVLQTLLKLALVQNMLRSSLFSEDTYALIKSCFCFLRFYITFCTALVFDYIVPQIALVKIVPRLSLFLEYNLDLCTAPVWFVIWKLFFGIWFPINFGL